MSSSKSKTRQRHTDRGSLTGRRTDTRSQRCSFRRYGSQQTSRHRETLAIVSPVAKARSSLDHPLGTTLQLDVQSKAAQLSHASTIEKAALGIAETDVEAAEVGAARQRSGVDNQRTCHARTPFWVRMSPSKTQTLPSSGNWDFSNGDIH